MTTPLVSTVVSEARPEAGGFGTLRALFGISRRQAYVLEKDGEIRFIRMRRRGNRLGRTLVNFDSVRAYLARCESNPAGPAPAKAK